MNERMYPNEYPGGAQYGGTPQQGWQPQQTATWDFCADLSAVGKGNYGLQLGLFDLDGSPLRMALRGYEDGWYPVGNFGV